MPTSLRWISVTSAPHSRRYSAVAWQAGAKPEHGADSTKTGTPPSLPSSAPGPNDTGTDVSPYAKSPSAGCFTNGGPAGSTATRALTWSSRSDSASHPNPAPSEWVSSTDGPMRSSSPAAPVPMSSCAFTMLGGNGSCQARNVAKAGSSRSPLPGHWVCSGSPGGDGAANVATNPSYAAGGPYGPWMSGWYGDRPSPGRSTV